MQQARSLGDLIDRAVGLLGQVNATQRSYTGYDFMAGGAIAHGAQLAKSFLVSPEGQFALGAANLAGRVASIAFDLVTDILPATAFIKGVGILATGQDMHGNSISRWWGVLYALPLVGKLAEVETVGMAVREATQGAEESAALAREGTQDVAAGLGEAARTEPTVGAEVAEAAAAERAEVGLGERATVSEGEVGLNGGSCSFSADTPVATSQGEQPIGDLRVGDHVLAYDQASGTTGSYTVTAVLVHPDPTLIDLTIDGERIQTTPEHPFFTQEQSWTPAGELQVGDHVRQANGDEGVVQAVVVVQRPQVMYNLTVATAHTFFVGDGQWLVHNTCFSEIQQRIKNQAKLLPASPARVPYPNATPSIQIADGTNRFNVKPDKTYLWVIDQDANLLVAEERTPLGIIKHTQITNWGKAYGGGEVIFKADGTIASLEANSGRYMGYNRVSRMQTTQIESWAREMFQAIGH